MNIETDRLILRPFHMGDLDKFATICADPEVMKYIGNGKPLDKINVKHQLESWIASYQEHGFGLMALTLKENQKLLGFCGLIQQTMDGEDYIELGYRLAKQYWKQGIATEAATAIKDYAHTNLGITRLISIIQVDNIASKKVAQKVGMKYYKRTLFKDVMVDTFTS